MIMPIIVWGTVAGLIHFVIIGALYGNPMVDRHYQQAQESEAGVKKWESRARYLVTQFLGTQVEVFILTAGFLWLRSLIGIEGLAAPLLLGLLFTGLRVYPRFWNMWIQSTYPSRLLAIEAVNGTISTFVVVFIVYFFAG